ncbi:hypothetical protein LTR85_002061 [Meristemomyces frigidus]|nr:hypothetical protein LTR85_002061 [Meristemomyces frigidus]
MANQAWQITSPGVLELKDLGHDIPMPGPRQALIRIQAVTFNYRDVLVVESSPDYPVKPKAGLVPCSDAAGTVEEAGPDSIWKKGDRVVIHPNTWLTGLDPRNLDMYSIAGGGDCDGTLRRWLVWDDARLWRAPEGLSIEESCTQFTAGNTAYRALFHGPKRIEPGMTILTQGTGGVSCFAIQIAAAVGATAISTSSSDEKLKVAQKLGAKHLINYRKTPKWEDEVLKATDGKGVDIVVDVVGAGSIEQTLKATRFGGAVVLVGLLCDDPDQKVNIMQDILYGAKTLEGHLGASNKEMADEFAGFIEKHDLHPEIALVFDFEDADKALEAARTLSAPGKVVVRV